MRWRTLSGTIGKDGAGPGESMQGLFPRWRMTSLWSHYQFNRSPLAWLPFCLPHRRSSGSWAPTRPPAHPPPWPHCQAPMWGYTCRGRHAGEAPTAMHSGWGLQSQPAQGHLLVRVLAVRVPCSTFFSASSFFCISSDLIPLCEPACASIQAKSFASTSRGLCPKDQPASPPPSLRCFVLTLYYASPLALSGARFLSARDPQLPLHPPLPAAPGHGTGRRAASPCVPCPARRGRRALSAPAEPGSLDCRGDAGKKGGVDPPPHP